MTRTDQVGSRSVTGRRVAPLAWLPWLALALLALLALLAFLIIRNVADDGDRSGVDARNDTPAASSGGAGGGGASQPAALSAGGQDLSGAAAAGTLGSLAGRPVEGRGVTVESVVADEAFWVGQPGRRVLVFLTPQARTRAGESPFQVQAGQRINMTGTVRPLPADAQPFGVDKREGADELRGQGHYIEATSIDPS